MDCMEQMESKGEHKAKYKGSPGLLSRRRHIVKKLKLNMQSLANDTLTWTARVICLVGCFTFWYNIDVIQESTNALWEILRYHWFYKLAYFETFFVVLYYTLFLGYPYVIEYFNLFNKYKLNIKDHTPIPRPLELILEVVVYVAPLATLDTFMVKKYAGVTDEDLVEVRKHWIQTERILPVDPPNVMWSVVHLIVAFIIYDFMFFVLHYALHKNRWLYDNIHSCHHNHSTGGINSRVTNKLNVVERVAIVLIANFALKVIGSHPLTRTLFIPLYVSFLVESHMGYDLPWSYNKIMPHGMMGGATAHYEHHIKGTKNFQPVFTYLDKYMLGN
ncbi:uncharacterized protein LOC102803507 [Saccoglossus kowalevskii]|uniref:Cholesterol 25-hydroxylase-like n=1 Tax=Saccoglossus kowalevskii TaxID=10224 RepID=A0ABM0MM08_SACKO|nr:PREDICTED: cholesterol 25-hydroxylase-like [Saccoglossus kowalevskii]